VARGEVLLFLHADCRLPDTALDDIRTLLSRPGVAAGAFRLSFDNPGAVYRAMSWVVSVKTRLGRSPHGDQGIFLRKAYFDEIGGFAPVRIMEDVELTRRIRRRGDRLVLAPSAIVTSSRRMESEGVARRVAKNGWMLTLFSLGVHPAKLERFYPPAP
jgi:GT2 family glycosyltransferase